MTPNAIAASAVAASTIPSSATLLSPLPPACPTAFKAPRSDVFLVASEVVVASGLSAEVSPTVFVPPPDDVSPPDCVAAPPLPPLPCVVPVEPLVAPPVAVGIVSMYC
jgi:hypothetical protein